MVFGQEETVAVFPHGGQGPVACWTCALSNAAKPKPYCFARSLNCTSNLLPGVNLLSSSGT
jgi:hypothetical protein